MRSEGLPRAFYMPKRLSAKPPADRLRTMEQQISGEANRRVLEQFPAELSAEEPEDEQARLETEIAQAENQLEMLRTEAKVLQLRRKHPLITFVQHREHLARILPGPLKHLADFLLVGPERRVERLEQGKR